MKHVIHKKIILQTFFALALIFFPLVHASAATSTLENCPNGRSGEKCTNLDNPLASKTTEVPVIIGKIIQFALSLMGSITLLMFVWGGFQWLSSAGNAEKIKKGSQTMIWAAIGVMLVLSSYIILTTYLDYLTGRS
jgi:hypothetical protein